MGSGEVESNLNANKIMGSSEVESNLDANKILCKIRTKFTKKCNYWTFEYKFTCKQI